MGKARAVQTPPHKAHHNASCSSSAIGGVSRTLRLGAQTRSCSAASRFPFAAPATDALLGYTGSGLCYGYAVMPSCVPALRLVPLRPAKAELELRSKRLSLSHASLRQCKSLAGQLSLLRVRSKCSCHALLCPLRKWTGEGGAEWHTAGSRSGGHWKRRPEASAQGSELDHVCVSLFRPRCRRPSSAEEASGLPPEGLPKLTPPVVIPTETSLHGISWSSRRFRKKRLSRSRSPGGFRGKAPDLERTRGWRRPGRAA